MTRTVRHPNLPLTRPILALLCLLAAIGVASAHPQDGPHCDLRLVVGERSVTWNIGLNLPFADEIVDVGREAEDVLAAVEEPAMEDALIAHFRSENPVLINGERVDPVVRQFVVGRADLALLPLFPRTGRRALTRFVCILEYPAPEGVDHLEATWSGYPIDILSEEREPGTAPAPMAIEAQLQAEGKVEIVRFLESVPTIVWDAKGADPAASLTGVPAPPSQQPTTHPARRIGILTASGLGVALIGMIAFAFAPARKAAAGLVGLGCILSALGLVIPAPRTQGQSPTIDEAYAASVVEPLLANAYEAFAHTEESVIYDLLARSADGEVLDRLYREVYRAMVVSDHDQGRAIIAGVTPIAIDLDGAGPDRFKVQAEWEATGSVYHWGHSHDRTYAYAAEISVSNVDGAWKMSGLTITDQRRLDADDGPDAFLPEGFEL
ncbi:MAG: hypothetical protein Tsb0013_06240 [Phycisphaerales bacterium]